MSCGMAAVPRLTSEGRELLILSRVWPKRFGSTTQTYCSSLPAPPHSLSPEHLVFLTPKPPFDLLCSNSLIRQMYVFLWQKQHYKVAHIHAGQGRFRTALQQWRPDKNCCVCTAPPRLLRFTRGPLWITSEWGQVSVCPICVPSKQMQPFTLLNAT